MRTLNYTLTIFILLITPYLFGQTFIENKGQVVDFNQDFHPEVKYYYSGSDAGVYFQNDRVVYNFIEVEEVDKSLYEDNVKEYEEALEGREATYYRMDLVFQNANSNVNISSGESVQGRTHFYLNKRNGIRDVQSFKSIRYNNIYSNIDAVFHNSTQGMKYDIILKENAKIEDVQLDFEGVDVKIKDEKLVIATQFGTITEEIPLSFINGDNNNKVKVNYHINKDGTVGFRLKDKVNYTTLTIDPVLEWATYYNQDVDPTETMFITLEYNTNYMDDDGNYYSYGLARSNSNTYPVVGSGGAYTANFDDNSDAYIMKFNTNRELVWATYLGGSGSDHNYGGRVMAFHGNTMHIVGEQISSGAPFTDGGGYFDNTTNSAFWARFNKNTGALEHLTSISKGDKPSIAISNSGKVAIICHAYDFQNLPIMNRSGAYNQGTNGGYKDMGLMMFDASYNQTWGTFLGGPSSQEGFTCAFDSNENLYFSGGTSWTGISGSNATSEKLVQLPGAYYQGTTNGGSDVMLGKFNSSGQLVWHTLYSGNGHDARRAQMGFPATVVIHPTTEELVLAFNTTSDDLPTVNLAGAYNKGVPSDPDFGDGGSFWNYAGYISKFSTAGVLNWGTYFYSNTSLSGTYIENIIFGGCDKFYIGADGDQNSLTGAGSGYNLTASTATSRNGYITMLNSSDFSFEWDSYLVPNEGTVNSYVAANINQAPFFVTVPVYYENIPVTDPGGGAYFDGTSWDATKKTFGILQFHPALPPEVDDENTCSGASVDLTATGGMGTPYNWYSSNTSSTVLHTGDTYTVNPTSNETYYVSSGTGMCASPRIPVSVVVEPGPDMTIEELNPADCNSPSDLEITDYDNTLTYTVSPSGATINSSGAIIGTPGDYTISVDDGNCSNDTLVTIDPSITPPTADANATNTTVCEGDDIELTAGNVTGATYSWSGPNGYSNSSQNPTLSNASSSDAGIYTLTVTKNSCSANDDVEIIVNPQPTANADAANTTLCEGEDIELTAGNVSGATYDWSGPNGYSNTSQNPTISNISTNEAGTYSLTVSIGGCSDNDDVNIAINPAPMFTVSSTDPSCGNNDGEIIIAPDGGSTINDYSINNGTNTQTGGTFPNLSAGNYTAYVKDNNGCVDTQSVSLNNSGAPTIDNISSTDASCTIDDGTITITASGGTGTIQYSIDNGTTFQNNGSFTGLGDGTYDIIVKDDNDCETSQTVTIDQMNAPNLSLVNHEDVTCNGDDNGSIEVEASGGNSPYTYSWSPNSSTSTTATDLSADDYTITVTDNAGCSDDLQVTINEPDAIAVTETITNTDCGQDNGSINLQTTGGDGSYTYSWSPSVSTTDQANGLTAGDYEITVTDGNGCVTTETYTVGMDGSFDLEVIPNYVTVKEGESIDIHTIIDSSITVDSIAWTPSTGLSCTDCKDPVANPKNTTTYYIEVFSSDGCSAKDSTIITVASPCAKIYVPTSFSPNGDGMNDLQCVLGECIATLEFTIFNRWGETVFQTSDQTKCWDGMFRGKMVQTGVYVYKLKATLDNGERIEESGNINVVR